MAAEVLVEIGAYSQSFCMFFGEVELLCGVVWLFFTSSNCRATMILILSSIRMAQGHAQKLFSSVEVM